MLFSFDITTSMWKLIAFALLVLGAQGKPSSSDGDGVGITRWRDQADLKDTAKVTDDLCKDREKIADPDDCRKFHVCKDNKLIDDKCFWPRKFDSIEKRCMWWGATCAIPTPAPPTDAPNPPPKEQKDQVLMRKLQSVEETPKDGECKDGDKLADPNDCKKYKECKDNKLVDDSCFWIRKFDSIENRCMWWGAKCAEPTPAPPTTVAPNPPSTTVAPNPPSTTVAPNPPPKEQKDQVSLRKLQSVKETLEDGDCKDGDKIADPDDCRKYKECKDNKFSDEGCFWPRKFDSIEMRCMWWGATCAKPASTQ